VNRVSITEVTQPSELETARSLFQEYAACLGDDVCLQGFGKELAGLPGQYARPHGRLLLASVDDQMAGCVALRRLEPEVCEMKRLYVRPEYRGLGVGRELTQTITTESRAAGYRRLRLDTLPSMMSALALYRRLGFREIPPYGDNRAEGAVYLELQLDRPSPAGPSPFGE